jgi:hypothetical protein
MQPWMSLRRVLCHGRWIGKRFRRASWRERRCLTRRVFVRDPTDSGWTSEIGYSKAVQRSAILINNSPKSHTTCLLPKREQRPTNSNKKDRHPPTNMPPNILHHQTPAGAQKWDALLTCTVTSLVLNACLHYTLSLFRPHSYFLLYVCVGRACISVFWIKLYQWLTGEECFNPLLNLAVTFLVPMLVENWWR